MLPGMPHPPPPQYNTVVRTVQVVSTSYSPCSSGTITATGTRVRPGVVAVPIHHPSIPLGSYIIAGHHFYHAEDHIGCCSQLDIYSADCKAAVEYGRRTISVGILGVREYATPKPHRHKVRAQSRERIGWAYIALALGAVITALVALAATRVKK